MTISTTPRMRMGEVAERAGVTARTVRYYESIRLIPKGERKGSGQHYYSQTTVDRLLKIEQLKHLGLSLEEIRGVIDLYFTDASAARAKRKVLGFLRAHLTDVDAKVTALEKLREDLVFHIERFELWLSQKHQR